MTAPRPLGYWVATVDRMLDEQFERAAETTGIGRREWQIMNRLHIGNVREDTLEATLAPFLQEREDLRPSLEHLLDEKLVEQRSGEYRLTDEGRARMERVQEEAVQGIRDRVMDGLTQEDYERLLATLERVARNLGWEPT